MNTIHLFVSSCCRPQMLATPNYYYNKHFASFLQLHIPSIPYQKMNSHSSLKKKSMENSHFITKQYGLHSNALTIVICFCLFFDNCAHCFHRIECSSHSGPFWLFRIKISTSIESTFYTFNSNWKTFTIAIISSRDIVWNSNSQCSRCFECETKHRSINFPKGSALHFSR